MASDRQILKRSITQLDKRRKELKKRLLATANFNRRFEILDQMDLISIRRAKLETMLNHIEASLVTVARPTDADRQLVEDSLATLSQAVAADMRWSAAVRLVGTIINAARTIRTNLDGRQTPTTT